MAHYLVGGLGGGGDVALALMLIRAAGISMEEVTVLSFLDCSLRRDRLADLAVEGSLIEIPPGSFGSERVFEDKLALEVPELNGRIYGICTRDRWEQMARGLEALVEVRRPRCTLHADLGGDGLVLGYEEGLGSFETDAVARALIYYISKELGVRSIVASGAVGAEGGGGELDPEWMAADIAFLRSKGALLGVTELREKELVLGYDLMRRASSGMLPLFLAASKGKRTMKVRIAYLRGEYELKPWYRYVFFLDARKHCELSPICLGAYKRGVRGAKEVAAKRRTPPTELTGLLKEVRRRGASKFFEELTKKAAPPRNLLRCQR